MDACLGDTECSSREQLLRAVLCAQRAIALLHALFAGDVLSPSTLARRAAEIASTSYAPGQTDNATNVSINALVCFLDCYKDHLDCQSSMQRRVMPSAVQSKRLYFR